MTKKREGVWVAELELPRGFMPYEVFQTKRNALDWQKEHPHRDNYRIRRYAPAPRKRR